MDIVKWILCDPQSIEPLSYIYNEFFLLFLIVEKTDLLKLTVYRVLCRFRGYLACPFVFFELFLFVSFVLLGGTVLVDPRLFVKPTSRSIVFCIRGNFVTFRVIQKHYKNVKKCVLNFKWIKVFLHVTFFFCYLLFLSLLNIFMLFPSLSIYVNY